MTSAARSRAWRLLGAVIAHVPPVFDDEPPTCAISSSGAVRVEVGPEVSGDVVWYYRRTEIVREEGGHDTRGNAGMRGYRTRRGYTRATLTEVVASIDEIRARRAAEAGA